MKPSTRVLSSLPALGALAFVALAALVGCQTSPEPGALSVSTAPAQETELRLVVKDDPTCLELRDSILAGTAGDSARAAFIAGCVVEVPPHDSLPPRPLPSPGLRCEWAGAQIDSGRKALIPAYVKHCPASCDSLAATDTAAFNARCVLPPRPVRPPRPPHDSAARAARCDSLKAVLAATDTASAEYGPLSRHVAAACKLPPPPRPDTVPACEVLKAKLAEADSGTNLHANMQRQVEHVCSLPRGPKPGPKPGHRALRGRY
jgi:hypothetical protein